MGRNWLSRSESPRFLVLLAFMMLVSLAGFAQSTGEAGKTGSIELLEELSALVEEKGLEVSACDQKTEGKGETSVNLVMKSDSQRQFIPFLQALKKKWNVVPQEFSARFNHDDKVSSKTVFLTFRALLLPGSTPESSSPLEDMLRVTESFSFFQGMGGPPPGKDLQLLGMTFKKDSWPIFQVVAGNLDGLSEFASSIKIGYTFVSLSRSSISGQDVYSLQLSLAPAGPPLTDFLGLFRAPALSGSLRELTLERRQDGQDQYHASLVVALPKADEAVRAVTLGQAPVIQVRATPETNGNWNLRSTFALFGEQKNPKGLSWGEIFSVLGEPWPPLLYSGMEFLWKLDGMTLTVEYANESDFAQLRPLAEKSGFRFQIQPLNGKDGGAAFRAVLTRSGGTPGPRGEATRPADTDGLPALGEVVTCQEQEGGALYMVKLPFSDLKAFLTGLEPRENRTMNSFELSDAGEGSVRVQISLLRSSQPFARGLYETVVKLCGADFPWNKSEADLKQGIVLNKVSINAKGQVAVAGKTLKSGKIFSDLFPKLEKSAGLKDPFFRSGTYRDHALGRVMSFEVTADRKF